MRLRSFALLGALVLSSSAGCGLSTYQASTGVHFDLDSSKQIDDEDVAKAFAARPQLAERSRVAYYTFDDDKAGDIEKALAAVPNVGSVYRIPPLLLTGRRKYQESSRWEAPQEVSVKKLRLLAARGNADVLVVFDHGWRGGGVNGLVALNVLVVPVFFVPFCSNETESYAQAYVIDVRNGYLYGEVDVEAKGGSGYTNIYAPGPANVANELWPKLLDDVKLKLATKLEPTRSAPRAAAR